MAGIASTDRNKNLRKDTTPNSEKANSPVLIKAGVGLKELD